MAAANAVRSAAIFASRLNSAGDSSAPTLHGHNNKPSVPRSSSPRPPAFRSSPSVSSVRISSETRRDKASAARSTAAYAPATAPSPESCALRAHFIQSRVAAAAASRVWGTRARRRRALLRRWRGARGARSRVRMRRPRRAAPPAPTSVDGPSCDNALTTQFSIHASVASSADPARPDELAKRPSLPSSVVPRRSSFETPAPGPVGPAPKDSRRRFETPASSAVSPRF